ncbi:hypothetical protein HJC23_000647 [Cyclotella cryptica]|uniref:Uncharacterized protein n=1 Tax=Cyclotella cryptica TaxID=29204 RepID=A0ABD3Q847_9STRA
MSRYNCLLPICASAMVALTNQQAVFAFHPPQQALTRTFGSPRPIDKKMADQHTLPLSPSSMSSTQLGFVLDGAGDISSFSTSTLDVASGLLSTESINVAFSVATFFPQIFWLFLILIPNANVTKRLMGGYGKLKTTSLSFIFAVDIISLLLTVELCVPKEIITLCCLVHVFIVTASIAQPDGTAPMAEFADVFDPSGDPQKAMVGMMQYPNFVSEEWSHVLTWDLFVGRWIWMDGLRRGIFTSHSVLLCNLIGPPGLLLHWVTCFLVGKGLPENDWTDEENGTDAKLK